MTTQRFSAVVAGLLATYVLALCFHWSGQPPQPSSEYRYSNFLLGALSFPFGVAYLVASAGLSFVFRRAWPVALGMMLPFPIAFGLEVQLHPSSHNLFPFEAVLLWLPAFLIALLGGCGGVLLARRRTA